MNKIYLIITLILIMVAGFYFLSQVQFKKEKPQIVYEENVDINPVIKTRPLSAKSFSVRYKNISFAITDIRFSSFEQAKSFVEEFIGYIQTTILPILQ